MRKVIGFKSFLKLVFNIIVVLLFLSGSIVSLIYGLNSLKFLILSISLFIFLMIEVVFVLVPFLLKPSMIVMYDGNNIIINGLFGKKESIDCKDIIDVSQYNLLVKNGKYGILYIETKNKKYRISSLTNVDKVKNRIKKLID